MCISANAGWDSAWLCGGKVIVLDSEHEGLSCLLLFNPSLNAVQLMRRMNRRLPGLRASSNMTQEELQADGHLWFLHLQFSAQHDLLPASPRFFGPLLWIEAIHSSSQRPCTGAELDSKHQPRDLVSCERLCEGV